MGRPGLTQSEFDAVADRLLAAGERPTVERMRQTLGTGSSQLVQRLLDAWWKALGGRLNASAAKLALPDAPQAVAALASQFWEQALAAAREDAEKAVSEERAALTAARLESDARVAAADQRAEIALAGAEEARGALLAAHGRLEDRQHLVDQQTAQILDLTAARDGALARGAELEVELATLRARLDQAAAEALAYRESQVEHLRAIEDRASQEIDRARQEFRESQRQSQAQAKAHQETVRALEKRLGEALASQTTLERELAVERARNLALERHVEDLRSRPKAAPDAGVRKRKAATESVPRRRPSRPRGES